MGAINEIDIAKLVLLPAILYVAKKIIDWAGKVMSWSDPTTVDISCPHDEACSKASGLTPPRWLWRRLRL